MASVVGEREIDLSNLSLEQINQLKNQHEEEVKSLTANYAALRDGLARYQESSSAVKSLGRGVEKKQILVPLTQSLYAPGHIVEGDKFIVDIGTGYYAEKSKKDTEDFLQRKIDMVHLNLTNLRELIDMKRKALDTLVFYMRQRISDIEKKRNEFKAQEAS